MSTGSFQPAASAPAARPAVARSTRRLSRRHVMLLALLPVLVVVWLPLLGGNRRPTPALPPAAAPGAPGTPVAVDPPAAPGAETAAMVPLAGTMASAGELTRRLRAVSAPFEPRWQAAAGDPFAAAPAARNPAGTDPDVGTLARLEPALAANPRLEPSAVLLSANQPPMAIIRGRAYRPGDDVDGCRIVAIEERQVVFHRGTKTFAVSIPMPTLGQEQPHD